MLLRRSVFLSQFGTSYVLNPEAGSQMDSRAYGEMDDKGYLSDRCKVLDKIYHIYVGPCFFSDLSLFL